MAGSRRSIAGLISLTLGLAGACGDDGTTGETGPNTTTDPSSGEGTMGESSMGESSSSATDTFPDPSDTDPAPCPEPVTTPFAVTDWPVTDEAYLMIQTSVLDQLGQAFDTLDLTYQCEIVCAYATDNLDGLPAWPVQYYDYSTMYFTVCEHLIPTADMDGLVTCEGERVDELICLGGRAPLDWSPRLELAARPELAARLDDMATMEAVSITAFEELAAQLERLGAPAQLIDRARAAASDERRHLRLLAELGGRGPEQLPAPAPAETAALTIAMHNAVEGCVHETWAALLARHQAEHAPEPSARARFAEIAADEARHAELAWDLHDWLATLLDAEQRAAVEAARDNARQSARCGSRLPSAPANLSKIGSTRRSGPRATTCFRVE